MPFLDLKTVAWRDMEYKVPWDKESEEGYLYRSYLSSEGLPFVVSFRITKYTPKGYWISYSGKQKFVPAYARNPFAVPKVRDSLRALYHRTIKWREYIIRDLTRADAGISLLRDYTKAYNE